jgi:hypothetical protein
VSALQRASVLTSLDVAESNFELLILNPESGKVRQSVSLHGEGISIGESSTRSNLKIASPLSSIMQKSTLVNKSHVEGISISRESIACVW